MSGPIPFDAYKVTEAVGGHVARFPFGTDRTLDRFSFGHTQLETLIDTAIKGAIAATRKAIEPPPAPVQPEIMEGDIGYRTGFMCLVDYEVELGEDSQGTPIYPDERSLRVQRKCVDSCGMAEVKITLTKVHPPTGPQKFYTFTEAEIETSKSKQQDAAMFRWFMSGDRTTTDGLLDLHMRQLNDDRPTLDEWRAAIDAAMKGTP